MVGISFLWSLKIYLDITLRASHFHRQSFFLLLKNSAECHSYLFVSC